MPIIEISSWETGTLGMEQKSCFKQPHTLKLWTLFPTSKMALTGILDLNHKFYFCRVSDLSSVISFLFLPIFHCDLFMAGTANSSLMVAIVRTRPEAETTLQVPSHIHRQLTPMCSDTIRLPGSHAHRRDRIQSETARAGNIYCEMQAREHLQQKRMSLGTIRTQFSHHRKPWIS